MKYENFSFLPMILLRAVAFTKKSWICPLNSTFPKAAW